MSGRPTVLERAFELARSGSCSGVSAIRNQLHLEGFASVQREIVGPALIKQLRLLCERVRDPAL